MILQISRNTFNFINSDKFREAFELIQTFFFLARSMEYSICTGPCETRNFRWKSSRRGIYTVDCIVNFIGGSCFVGENGFQWMVGMIFG